MLDQQDTVARTSSTLRTERRKTVSEFLQLAQATAGVILWERTIRDSGDSLRWYGENSVLYGRVVRNLQEWLSIIHPDDRPRVEALVTASISGHEEFDIEYRVIWPDNSIHWIYGRGKVLYDAEGKAERMIGANINVTRHKELEDQARSAEKSALLGRLLSAVMHEINNPLESVNHILYLLEQNPNLDDDSRAIVERAIEQMERARQVAENTLTLSRPGLTLARVDVREVLDSVLQHFRDKIQKVRITVDRKYATVETVSASESHLRQVFANLIRNAIEASGPNGRVAVRVRQVHAPALGGSAVRVCICDSGRGLDGEAKKRLAEPFFSQKQNGTGLGLWVSTEIIRKHGGYIRARNVPGSRGACFAVLLPAS